MEEIRKSNMKAKKKEKQVNQIKSYIDTFIEKYNNDIDFKMKIDKKYIQSDKRLKILDMKYKLDMNCVKKYTGINGFKKKMFELNYIYKVNDDYVIGCRRRSFSELCWLSFGHKKHYNPIKVKLACCYPATRCMFHDKKEPSSPCLLI